MAIDSQGHLYTWGKNTCGQIGNESKRDQRVPYRVAGPLHNQVITHLFISGDTSAVQTRTGVYLWGFNHVDDEDWILPKRMAYDNLDEMVIKMFDCTVGTYKVKRVETTIFDALQNRNCIDVKFNYW